MHFALLPAHVPVSVRWFETAIEDNHFAWLVTGDRFYGRVVPLLFGICVCVAMRHTQTESTVAAIWPANGLLLAALLLSDSLRVRLHTVVGCFGINVFLNLVFGQSIGLAAGSAGVNVVEVVIALLLLERLCGGHLDFGELRTVIKFIAVCLVSATLPSVAGAFIIAASTGADVLAALSVWYLGDVMGLLVITPAVALALRPGGSVRTGVETSQVVTLYAGLIAVCALVFGQTSVPMLFVVTPVCVAIAFQLGPRHAAFATLFLSIVSIYATYAGFGPAAISHTSDDTARVWLVQLFCLVNLFTTLFVAAAVAERDAMRERVEQLSAADQNNRRTLDAALDAMNQGLCIFDKELKIVARNDRFLQMYALSGDAVTIGLPFESLVKLCAHSPCSMPVAEAGLPLLANGDVDQLLSDNRTIRISQRRTPNGVTCTYTDITADRQAEDALRHISMHDALTGLPNRRFFAEELSRLCSSGHADEEFCVMLIDVDHFKHVNDSLGHAAGDELLKVVGARLTSCVREFDTVARIGGDEFAIILHDGGETLLAHDVARRILEAVKRPVTIDGHVELISLSIGVARKEPGINADVLMKRADVALYSVKQNGRNNVKIFTAAGVTEHQAASEAA